MTYGIAIKCLRKRQRDEMNMWRGISNMLMERCIFSAFQVPLSGAKGALYANDGCYDDLNMDEIDMGFENYDELFGMPLDNPKNIFGNDGIFGMQYMSTSNCEGASAAEVIPIMKFLKTQHLFLLCNPI